MSKKKSNASGLVYSTNQDFFNQHHQEAEETITLPKQQQKLRVQLETKHRGGKAVLVVKGFIGSDSDLQVLGTWLKTKCGTGGSVKDGEILVQGSDKEKVVQLLLAEGYTQTK